MKYAAQSLLFVVALASTGCDDPSKNKAQAQVGSAIPVSSTSTKGDAYTLDAASSKVDFVGSNITTAHAGGFKKVSGTATLNGSDVVGAFVSIGIDTTSTYSDDEKLTKHLMSEEFFDTKKFPSARFVSTDIKQGGAGGTHTVTGNLTLHGKTKSISIVATIKQQGNTVSVKSEFSINRKDFDIMYAGKKDDLIRDGVVMKLELTFSKNR